MKGTDRLLIWGEGGCGKTSLACRIGILAMAEDHTLRPARRLMLPALLETELDFKTTADRNPLSEAIHGAVQDFIKQEPISEPLLSALLEHQRILVILDRFSELSEQTRKHVRPELRHFPARALIVTSRRHEELGRVNRTVLEPLRVQQDYLSEFLSAYLRERGARQEFSDSEFFFAAGRLSAMVGDKGSTVLFARLFAEQMISVKRPRTGQEKLPVSLPELILNYINNLNDAVPDAERREDISVHRDAQAVAWECVKSRFRPSEASIEEQVLPALAKISSGEGKSRPPCLPGEATHTYRDP